MNVFYCNKGFGNSKRLVMMRNEMIIIMTTTFYDIICYEPLFLIFPYQHIFSAQRDPRIMNFVKLRENQTLAGRFGI